MSAEIQDITIDGYGYDISTQDGSMFKWAVRDPSNTRIARGQSPDIDSAYAECEGVVLRQGGSIARASVIEESIKRANPSLSRRSVASLTNDVVKTLLGD